MAQVSTEIPAFELNVDVVIVGAGACGLSAALAAAEGGAEVLVIERDDTPLGSTAMSTGLIPAAGTPEQAAQGIADSPEIFAADIMAKTKGKTDPAMALRIAQESAETVAWLREAHGVNLTLLDGFLYPGHSHRRMYGLPTRSGAALQGALEAALGRTEASLLTSSTVETLYVDGERIAGVRAVRPDGSFEDVGCQALILACCGFGANTAMVARYIPEIAEADYFGHPGNLGDAMVWGEQLGAALADMTGYQGHGGLAVGHGVPILWPLIMAGGVQVNANGERFSDESEGYSEQAAKVNAQPGGIAWSIFDEPRHELMLQFEDYRDALQAGAVVQAGSLEDLAQKSGLPLPALAATLAEVEAAALSGAVDAFGRSFAGKAPLSAPYRFAKVTGVLFHTQGGLVVDGDARVLRPDGTALPNLFAGGGAARGISGPGAGGYMAGNGLVTATTLGKLAGRAAARQIRS